MKISKGFNTVLMIFVFVFLFTKNASATFDISAYPYEGGYDLRFGKISTSSLWINKEVTVRVTTNVGKQYRVIQTLLEPLSDAVGNRIPEGNFVVYCLRGTNAYGTVNVESQRPVSLGRMIIYTSNQQGLSDSFILVYRLQISPGQAPGLYRGRIAYSLEPIDSGQSPATEILNISCQVEAQASIEINTVLGSKSIQLDPTKPDRDNCDIIVKINGTLGTQFKIMQIFDPLVSSEGNQLSENALEFEVRGASHGQAQADLTGLSGQPQVVYLSSPRGEQDSFVINLSLKNLEKEKAGIYRGNLKYFLEGGLSIQSGLIQTLFLEVNNPRLFDLVITPQMGGTIQFRDLKPLEPPREYQVDFQIKTNTGKPYQISQKLISEFTNKEGEVIPKEYFSFRVEPLDTKGVLKFLKKTEIKIGDMILFVSDKLGSPDTFRIIYELGTPLNIKSGDYSTGISYALSEI